jgi:hypothetical protein
MSKRPSRKTSNNNNLPVKKKKKMGRPKKYDSQ